MAFQLQMRLQRAKKDERDQSRVAKDVAQRQCAEAEEVRRGSFFFFLVGGKWVGGFRL